MVGFSFPGYIIIMVKKDKDLSNQMEEKWICSWIFQ